MPAKSNNERQDTRRNKMLSAGYVRFETWIKPEHREQIKRYIAKLNKRV